MSTYLNVIIILLYKPLLYYNLYKKSIDESIPEVITDRKYFDLRKFLYLPIYLSPFKLREVLLMTLNFPT